MKQTFNNDEILLFHRGDVCFGVGVDNVVRIANIPAYGINSLPIPCQAMYGLINLEGTIIPVAHVPYLPSRINTKENEFNILVLQTTEGHVFSIGADRFDEIINTRSMNLGQIDKTPYSIYCDKVMRNKEKKIWVINVNKMYKETIRYAREADIK